MKEKLKKMTNEQLIARRDELKAIGENPENRSADELEQLAEERTAIDEELTERRAAAAREQLRRDAVAGMVGANVRARQPQQQEQRELGADSAEYRTAWLKKMAVRDGVALFGELTEAENLRRLVARMTKQYREVLTQHYFRGLGIREIAEKLSIPENTVKSRLRLGRDKLRKELTMEKYEKQSFAPETLWIAGSGSVGMDDEPYSLVKDDRIAMNLLILAYEKPVTLPELADAIGISTAYIEPVVERLVNGELMKRTEDKVFTDFIIYTEEDRLSGLELQKELAARQFDVIWKIVEEGLDVLRNAAYYTRQNASARLKLEGMQVASMRPNWVTEDEVPQAELDKETEIIKNKALDFGVFAAVAYLVAFGQAHRDTEGAPARDNRNLVERVRMLAQERHERVTRFVVGRVAFFFVGHEERSAFGTHAELVAGFLEVEHRDFLVVEARGEEGSLVHEVLEVCAGESRRAFRDGGNVHVLVERDLSLLQVHLQYFFAALHVG